MQINQRPLSGSKPDQELFVGRVAELARLRRAMDLRFNVLLLGDRGMGATSLIHHCSALIHDEELLHNEAYPSVRCLIVDVGAARDICELLTTICQFLKSGNSSLENLISRGRHAGKLYQGTYMSLITELCELAYAVQAYNGFDPTIIIDNMNDTKLAHDLFGRREDLWKIPFNWVICGRLSRRTEYLTPPVDAFFDTELILEPLDDSVAQSLLEVRIDPTNSASSKKILSHSHEIVKRGNGNPRQILNEARSIALQKQSNLGTDEHVLANATKPSNTEEAVLQYLQYHGPTSASDVEFQDYMDVTRERLTQVLRKLEHKGLVFSFLDKSGAGRPRKCYSSLEAAYSAPTPSGSCSCSFHHRPENIR